MNHSTWICPTLATVIFCTLWLWLSVGSAQQEMNGRQLDSGKMVWVPASNSTALCNDFTRAGFFIRQNQFSRDWVVFLESGGLCYNTESCNRRFFVRQVGAKEQFECIGTYSKIMYKVTCNVIGAIKQHYQWAIVNNFGGQLLNLICDSSG